MGSGSLVALMARLHSFRRPTYSANSWDGCTAPPRALVRQDDDDLSTGGAQAEDGWMDMPAGILRSGGSCRCSADIAEQQLPTISSSCAFDVTLAERLQHLQLKRNGGRGSAHLNWLLDASASSLSTLSSFTSLLNHHHRHQAHLIRPADELLSMLDVCISLQHIADDADRHLLLFQRALLSVDQALQRGSASKLRTAARRLSSSLHAIQGIASNHYRPVAEAHAALLRAAKRSTESAAAAPRPAGPAACPIISQALDATLLVSLLVISAALSSFAAPSKSSATQAACKVIARYVSTATKNATAKRSTTAPPPTWVAPLRQLQCDLKQEDMSAAFLQLQAIHASSSSLHAAITSTAMTSPQQLPSALLSRNVDSLRKSSQELQMCISTLRSHLASLFQALLALRLALLH